MKSILSLSLLALFSVSTSFTNNSVVAHNTKLNDPATKVVKFGAHWNNGPCFTTTSKNSIVINGFAAGLADGPLFASVDGSYACQNNGKQYPTAWNDFHLDGLRVTKENATGGNAKLTISFNSLCAHANWTFLINTLSVTIYNANGDVIGATECFGC